MGETDAGGIQGSEARVSRHIMTQEKIIQIIIKDIKNNFYALLYIEREITTYDKETCLQ